MNNYEYKFLTTEEVQVVILSALTIRPMTESELCDVVAWADDAMRRWGIMQNVFAGTVGLEPLSLPDRGVVTRLINQETKDNDDDTDQTDIFAPAEPTQIC